ncbi:MAG: zinc-binding dehydrogenase [Blastopirellula sp.]|nr:zinc-binding dehydrogenase [Blastopirellula sp.]
MYQLPSHMQAVLASEHGGNVQDAIRHLTLGELPVPVPQRGEVLVKIEAAPCNPSDLIFLQGLAGETHSEAAVPGWEGAGKVVASGGGWLANWLRNRRVACAAPRGKNGTWAEYMIARATDCIPLRTKLRYRQAASLIINPLSAIGLLSVARASGHHAAVSTAAASQLGRMLVMLSQQQRFPMLHIVRRATQVDQLHSLGAEHVLNSSATGFYGQLAKACRELKVTCALDAIAGTETGKLLKVLPRDADVIVYGALSSEPCGQIDPVELIYHGKRIDSFYLNRWIRKQGTLRMLRHVYRIQNMMLAGKIQTQIQREAGFVDLRQALEQYVSEMSLGKVLLVPSKT